MKALSIRQPWAWLICNAGKDCENRTRRFNHRGPLLVHASATMTRADYEASVIFVSGLEASDLCAGFRFPSFEEVRKEMGGIVGIVEVHGCYDESPSPWFCGPWALEFSKMRPLPFFPCKGQLSLFEVEYPWCINPLPVTGAGNL